MNVNRIIRQALLTVVVGFHPAVNGQQFVLSMESDLEPPAWESDLEPPACRVSPCTHLFLSDPKEHHIQIVMEVAQDVSDENSEGDKLLLDSKHTVFYPMGSVNLTEVQQDSVRRYLEYGLQDQGRDPEFKTDFAFIAEELEGKVFDPDQIGKPYTVDLNDAEQAEGRGIQASFVDNHGNSMIYQYVKQNKFDKAVGRGKRSVSSPLQEFLEQLDVNYCPGNLPKLACFQAAAEQSYYFDTRAHQVFRRQSEEASTDAPTEGPTEECIDPLGDCQTSLKETTCQLNRTISEFEMCIKQRDDANASAYSYSIATAFGFALAALELGIPLGAGVTYIIMTRQQNRVKSK